MKKNNRLALIIAYYLSKYDRKGLQNLGYSSFSLAFEDVGAKLNVKRNSVKNMRDEFDPIHDNRRVGWYQRELRPSRRRVAEVFQDLNEITFREIITDIINNEHFRNRDESIDYVLRAIEEDKDKRKKSKKKLKYIPRGPTGKAAENYFINYFNKTSEPVQGILKDMREYGCGYDFEIHKRGVFYAVEVKGLAEESGGISFTDKEWRKANELKDKYYLAIVRNLSAEPRIIFVHNPASVLKPERNIYPIVQVSWVIKENQLKVN